jgi:hypothetical protein
VTVTAGLLTGVTVPLLPWPDGGGGFGVNTPPHITSVSHPTAMASNGTATFTATAVDPDSGATLTYQWLDDVGGTFSGGDVATPSIFSNVAPGDTVSVGYTPPAGFVGTATVRVIVFDGTATATTTFPVRIGSGIDVGLIFDVLPEIQFLAASSQELLQGGTSVIDWTLVYPGGTGPDAPTTLEVTTAWTDSCGGGFSPATGAFTVVDGLPVGTQQVTYTAPVTGDLSVAQCDLTLTVTDLHGAEVFSKVIVWVNPGAAPAADFTGAWTGPIAAPGDPANTFNLRMDLAQSGGAVTGTFDVGWAVTGTASGSTLTFHATLNNGNCVGAIDGTGIADGGSSTFAVSFGGETQCFLDPPFAFAYEGTLTRYAATAMVVFATTTQVDGAAFGGSASAADAFCQAEAEVGIQLGLTPPGTYAALLSFPGRDAGALIVDVPYFLPDGTVVAGGRSEFLGGTLRHAIDINQNRSNNVGPLAWTGSLPDGTYDAIQGQCAGWTSSGVLQGTVGQTSSADSGWSTAAASACSAPASVYCIQLSSP